MILYPNAKINIGLNIVAKRNDGFHDIETIFYPIKKQVDILEVLPVENSSKKIDFSQSGLKVDGPLEENLCYRAYNLLSKILDLPPIRMHLHKQIPFGAGLGGGSSDGASALIALNSLAHHPLSDIELHKIALQLGSDCPFFIQNKPCFATGRGEKLEPIEIDLNGYNILLVNPNIHINTGKAYSLSNPRSSNIKLPELVKTKVVQWKNHIQNDFEKIVFSMYPEVGAIKEKMYEMGADYASMSGSGSTIFGLFRNPPTHKEIFSKYYCYTQSL